MHTSTADTCMCTCRSNGEDNHGFIMGRLEVLSNGEGGNADM